MIEQERKFLLNGIIPEGLVPQSIMQAYLMLEDGKQLRVRIVDGKKAYICYKKCFTPTVRAEYEYEIPLEDALELYKDSKLRIDKTRYSTSYGANHVDIDIYPDGKRVVEVEYDEDEPDADHVPYYCGKEVTGDKQYSNIYMAKQYALSTSDTAPM